jgi:serine/threonine-protein kinase
MMEKQQYLNKGTLIYHKKYTIVEKLEQEGFCFTYRATTKVQDGAGKWMDKEVRIKELFIADCCERDAIKSNSVTGYEQWNDYKKRFKDEAEKSLDLKECSENNIVKVLEVFEDNNTVYIAMEYIEGTSLLKYMEQNKSGLPEEDAIKYVQQIAKALKYVHEENITHLGLNPTNIILCNDTVKVTDFGLLKLYNDTGKNSSKVNPVSISEGYSPLELYLIDGWRKSCPASDIYSLGAIFYFLLTGKEPPSAEKRLFENVQLNFLKKGSRNVQEVIVQAMQLECKRRPQSIADFLAQIEGINEKKKKIRHSSWIKWGSVVALVVASVGFVLFYYLVPIKTITGNVSYEKKGLDSVHISTKEGLDSVHISTKGGIRRSTQTEDNGDFSFCVPLATKRIIFSKEGYNTRNAAIAKFMDVKMNQTKNVEYVEVDLSLGVTLELVCVPKGKWNNQTVNSFLIGKFEVTQNQWEAIMKYDPSLFHELDKKYKKDYPVESVSLEEIQKFLKKLSKTTNMVFDLPTETQWKYAFNGGIKSHSLIYSGSGNIKSVAWYEENCNGPQAVGGKNQNQFGIYDMSGNVYELYTTDDKICRNGGGWHSAPDQCTHDAEPGTNEYVPADNQGFRVVTSDFPK